MPSRYIQSVLSGWLLSILAVVESRISGSECSLGSMSHDQISSNQKSVNSPGTRSTNARVRITESMAMELREVERAACMCGGRVRIVVDRGCGGYSFHVNANMEATKTHQAAAR